jgi:hypothetical protein
MVEQQTTKAFEDISQHKLASSNAPINCTPQKHIQFGASVPKSCFPDSVESVLRAKTR